MEKKFVISLGRQFGSGGRQVGIKLAKLLGIAYYDRELMEETARNSGMDIDYLNKTDEQAPGFFDYALVGRFGASHPFGSSQNFVLLSETIKEIAAKHSCLIVGRSADYILRNEPGLIKIFVHAPIRYRIRNVAKRMQVSAEEAEKIINRQDKARARFYNFFTDKTWGQADSYDISVDIARLGEEETIQMLADYIHRRISHFK